MNYSERFMGDISIYLSIDLKIKIVNKSIFDFLKYSEREMIGKSINEILPDYELQPIVENKTDYIPFLDTFALTRSGEKIPFSVSAAAFHDKSGAICGIWLLLQDSYGRNLSRIPLVDIVNRYKAMTEHSLDAVIVINSANHIIEWNERAKELFGWSQHEAIGAELSKLIIPKSMREMHRKGMQRFIETGKAKVLNQRLELTALHRDGSKFPVELTVTPIKWGDTYLFSSFVRDISHRKQFERQLITAKDEAEKASRAKSEFLATISHEIRTPLNGVVGMAHLLGETGLTAQQQEYMEHLTGSASALLSVIQDVLDFSKIESGQVELDLIPFELKPLLEEVFAIFNTTVGKKGLELSSRIAPDVPASFHGDASRLRQILVNLIGNAIKFTEAGRVSVDIRQEDPPTEPIKSEPYTLLKFTVTDTGIGIDPTKREKLFQPFSQLDSSMTRRYGGTGLGLAISRKLAEAMGGKIWMEGHEGPGASFAFTVRLFPAMTSTDSLSTEIQAEAPEVTEAVILIGEDNEINQMVLQKMLEKNGYRSDLANTGTEVVNAVMSKPYHLVFMDMNMPELDGIEATIQIRNNLPTERQPKIVAVTAHAFNTDREKCLAAGMDDYISKPIQRDELQRVLRLYIPDPSRD